MTAGSRGNRRLSAVALESRNHTVERERVISRKELAQAGRHAMKALDLRPAQRLILAELVGCWGETMIGERILVYPSNDYLVNRTGLSERTVRNGIRGLVESGLVVPKDSANGKRFAIKNRTGELVDAFGFDLTPVYARRGEWVDLMAKKQAIDEARSRLFDEITICRRAIEEVLVTLPDYQPVAGAAELQGAFESISGTTPRRNKTAHHDALQELTDAWRDLRATAEEIFYKAASGGKLCQHIETSPPNLSGEPCNKKPPKKAGRGEYRSPIAGSYSLELIRDACSGALEFYGPIETEVDLVAAGRSLRSSLSAHPSAWDEAIENIGPVPAAIAVLLTLQLHTDDTSSGANRIKNPGGYFRAMVRLIKEGRLDLRAELMTLIRKRNL